MSYKVLARKWRPKDFSSVINQKHVVIALVNALDNERLHHAYLFSGTRGVGKTTIARIFAKALSCEQGVSSKPCGECVNCQEIDQGRYLDLLEVDAASRTGVDDTRELLENVQYAPGRGRYKIYLIDEVHMFSKSSFNALLKTLEEPPEHVIFMLVTTDPEKLPITVLSRCLQFNLSRVATAEIATYLADLLKTEKIEYEKAALKSLAEAADGSMRDALSLLDQAIVFGGGTIKTIDTATMLGSIEHRHISAILQALADGDANKLMQLVTDIGLYSTEFSRVLDDLAREIHELSLAKILNRERALADKFSSETLQLYYQIAIKSRQDLTLAPDPKTGLEMSLIRMLAFTPELKIKKKTDPKQRPDSIKAEPALNRDKQTPINDKAGEQWEDIITQLDLTGLALEFARNCSLRMLDDNTVELEIAEVHSGLGTDNAKAKLQAALANRQKNQDLQLKLVISQPSIASPALKQRQTEAAMQEKAENSLVNDPHVKDLINTFDAAIDKDSIQYRK